MELVKIDHKEFGIQETKAKEISSMFKPMLDRMVELEEQANEVLALPMNKETYAKARELRLEYKKTRTGTSEIHKKAKAYTLNMGRFIDGWKNTQAMASQGVEQKLADIENYEALEEEKRIADLQVKREKALKKFDVEVIPENLGELDKVTWINYLTGTKVNFDKKKQEEKDIYEKELKIEKDRKANEVKLALHNERIIRASPYKAFIPEFENVDWGSLENKEMKDFIDKAVKAKEAKDKEDERVRQENERLLRESKERKEKEERERKKNEAKLAEEREKREAAEKIISDHKEEEARKAQEDLNRDDAGKVKSLIDDLSHLAGKYTFKSVKNQKMYKAVIILISKIITYIEQS